MTTKKKIYNGIFLAIVFFLTLYGVFHGEDLSAMQEAISDAKTSWLILGAALVAFFIWGESIIIWYLMRKSNIFLRKRTCFLFSSVGFFFSCITPSASGGQPMQIYYMKKEKIPIPVSTVVLMIVTITYKLVLVLIGIGLLLFSPDLLHRYMDGVLPVFYLGLWMNIFCVAFMSLLVFHPRLAGKILIWGLLFLNRIHLLKKKEESLAKLEHSMESYAATARYLKLHPGIIINVLTVTFLQRIALFAATWCVYQSFDLKGTGAWTVILLQAAISVSVDMLPLPGGMGISETLFLTIFQPVFGRLLLPAMVLSRGLGYYGELLISAVFTAAAQFTLGKKETNYK